MCRRAGPRRRTRRCGRSRRRRRTRRAPPSAAGRASARWRRSIRPPPGTAPDAARRRAARRRRPSTSPSRRAGRARIGPGAAAGSRRSASACDPRRRRACASSSRRRRRPRPRRSARRRRLRQPRVVASCACGHRIDRMSRAGNGFVSTPVQAIGGSWLPLRSTCALHRQASGTRPRRPLRHRGRRRRHRPVCRRCRVRPRCVWGRGGVVRWARAPDGHRERPDRGRWRGDAAQAAMRSIAPRRLAASRAATLYDSASVG
jgi:hypothetical protein